MRKYLILCFMISIPCFATSIIHDRMDTPTPRFSFLDRLPVIPKFTPRECNPTTVINSGTPLTPEIRNEFLDILKTLEPSFGNPLSEDANKQEDAKKILEDLMSAFSKKKDTPIFLDPKTGKMILSGDLAPNDNGKKPEEEDRLDALKGCVSRTICTGTGKDKECTTWEICLSSD